MEGENWSVESSWIFRDKKYTVGADVREDLLIVQVEEVVTADRWKGQFEPKRKPLHSFMLWFAVHAKRYLVQRMRPMVSLSGQPSNHWGTVYTL